MTKTKLPKVVEVRVYGLKLARSEWKYDRKTGKITLKQPVPKEAGLQAITKGKKNKK